MHTHIHTHTDTSLQTKSTIYTPGCGFVEDHECFQDNAGDVHINLQVVLINMVHFYYCTI